MVKKRRNFVILGIPLMDVTKNNYTERFLYALKVNDTGDAKCLLGEGIDVNAPLGRANWPPLHQAVAYGHLEMVELLLQQGADPNLRIQCNSMAQGMVPLDFATNEKLVERLMQAGANPDRKDKKGMTPVDYAVFRRLDGVVRTFQSYRAQALTA